VSAPRSRGQFRDLVDTVVWGAPEAGDRARERDRVEAKSHLTGMADEQADWDEKGEDR
jgi:hypothetical protein